MSNDAQCCLNCRWAEWELAANARLIAKAPDLYDLAQDILAGADERTPKPLLEKATRLIREIDGED